MMIDDVAGYPPNWRFLQLASTGGGESCDDVRNDDELLAR
jgi:hypothetical protein